MNHSHSKHPRNILTPRATQAQSKQITPCIQYFAPWAGGQAVTQVSNLRNSHWQKCVGVDFVQLVCSLSLLIETLFLVQTFYSEIEVV